MEALSNALDGAVLKKEIKVIKIRISLESLEKILLQFANSSGLHMNSDKSNDYACSRGAELMAWCQNWNLDFGTLPTKYLGLPVLQKGMIKAIFQPLIDRVIMRV